MVGVFWTARPLSYGFGFAHRTKLYTFFDLNFGAKLQKDRDHDLNCGPKHINLSCGIGFAHGNSLYTLLIPDFGARLQKDRDHDPNC